MQRTRITAKVLATVAMAAVSGCVSVDPRPAPVPAAPETGRPASQDVAPQIVEGPAREALEAALPPPPAAPPRSPSTGAPRRPPAAAPSPDPPAAPRAERPPRLPSPERIRERLPEFRPPSPPSIPVTAPDVCALGRGYGGWHPDSQEARICRETYGR
ncbi:hypothetical protein QWM81_21225 [Streptomyces ficellus]|uniref:Lipoprotein n=1 Tax=Streptomyces ficellus TaxID=1977088 RepID=A0ABT7ZAJ0_9ACTN|nr:hypothetical protein [Streptomyces ficellus]MDN3296524.1 hypothetical protein [Streptomyces ficellus]